MKIAVSETPGLHKFFDFEASFAETTEKSLMQPSWFSKRLLITPASRVICVLTPGLPYSTPMLMIETECSGRVAMNGDVLTVLSVIRTRSG